MNPLLTPSELREVGSGFGTEPTLARLTYSQLGKRRLLVGAAARIVRSDCELLRAAEARDVAAVDAVVGDPFTDAWATGCIRDQAPEDTDRLHLRAIEIAAAVRAGLIFSCTIECPDGRVVIPTLGAASDLGAGTVTVTGQDGCLTLAGSDRTIAVVPGRLDDPHWHPLRVITVGFGTQTLTLAIDDLHPYRNCYPWKPTSRLTSTEFHRLADLIDGAWNWITAHSPGHMASIQATVRTLVQLVQPAGAVNVSAASRLAFGAIGLAPPQDAETLALLLIHETQHVKLGAVVNLVDLYDGTGAEIHRAPWRIDPRPVGALIQGAYAHLGVADFWRLRKTDPDADTGIASFEFAYSCEMTRRAVSDLIASGEMTTSGLLICAAMVEALDSWEPLAAYSVYLRAAVEVADADAVRWGLVNRRPAVADVVRLVRLWHTRAPVGLPVRLVVRPRPAEANTATGLSAALRSQFTERAITAGQSAEIMAYLREDDAVALTGFRARVVVDPGDTDAWIGWVMTRKRLGLDGPHSAMLSQPGLVRDCYRELSHTATPEEVAAWLDGMSTQEAARHNSLIALPRLR